MVFEAQPILANALEFAFSKATTEGKITISLLAVVSLFSWTVMITKARQLLRARAASRKFFEAFRATRDPLDLFRDKKEFNGSPAFEVYYAGAEELSYHLQNNPVKVGKKVKVSGASFESVRVALERSVTEEAGALEKGMIVLTTAVSGGPFIGLLGTVWGVMETFSGIAVAKSASLTVMAPGVAGALIATVIGLFVAIPAMFAYNMMVTTIRSITQELDVFISEYGTAIEHNYVDNRSVAEEVANAIRNMQTERADREFAPVVEPA